MTVSFRPSSLRNIVLGLASAALACTFTGCGIGMLDTTPPAAEPVFFTGSVHGGESPVIYSKVSFYETSATGVATVASATNSGGVYVPASALTAIGSTYTDSNGNFTFGTPLVCSTSTDYVYAVAAGGNSGSYPGTLNPQLLLMAAVGPCTSFGASTSIVINEVTTVAAAYALSGFTSISGSYTSSNGTAINTTAASSGTTTAIFTGANSVVSGQPITVTACTATSGSSLNGSYFVQSATAATITVAYSGGASVNTGCVVTPIKVTAVPVVSVTSSSTNYATINTDGTSNAGLAHAFSNAFNLVSSNAGVAWNNSPTNPAAVVPSALINSIANSLQMCVNSTGGAATSAAVNDGTNCGKLFSYTANVQVTPNIVPTTTLQAVLNIAHFPTQNVPSIYGLGSGMPAFALALGGTPTDFSMAIAYTKYTGNTNSGATACPTSAATVTSAYSNGLCYPYSLTLDAADDVIVSNTTASTSYASNVISFTSAGAVRFTSAYNTTVTQPVFLAADRLGNVFLPSNTTTGTILEVSGSTGAATATQPPTAFSTAYGIAIDKNNNLFLSNSLNTTTNNLYEEVYNSGTATYASPVQIGITPNATTRTYEIGLDAYDNAYFNQYNTATAVNACVDPVGSTSSTTEICPSATGTTSLSSYGIAVDSSNIAWFDGTATINKMVPTLNGSNAVTAVTATNIATYTPSSGGTASLRYMNFDGNNTLWAVDNDSTNSAIVEFQTVNQSLGVIRLQPCIVNTSTTCPTPGSAVVSLYGPRYAQIDSTGSIWVVSSTNGEILQFIGTAAPTEPLLAVQKNGLMP